MTHLVRARRLVGAIAAATILATVATGPPRVTAQAPATAEAQRLITELGLREAETPVRETTGWKKPSRIVITDVPPERLASLREVAPGVELVAAGSSADARREAATADALIGSCDASILGAGEGIRWVQTYNAGVERCLASPIIAQRGILLTNMQRIAGPAMAEHVIALMLSFARSLPAYHDAQRRRAWDRTPEGAWPAFSLDGKTMLVVGLGGVGTEVARRAHGLGMTVLATRASSRPAPPFVSKLGGPDDLVTFARDADIVVNALPLTDDTRGTFDAKVFAAMKPSAYLINVGRGATVVTADLVKALAAGTIAGAGLDVTDPEPLPSDHPLWTMGNVIITPHSSSDSDLDEPSRWMLVRENLRRYVAGERMLSVVDPARGY